MPRLTIDYGIDLGTTNSSIAVFEKNGPRVIRNNDNWQFTPSAVWVDKNGAIRVGLQAKEKATIDPDNGAFEFKRMMGKTYSKAFARLPQPLTPDSLSAEVLKSLKEDVRRDTGEELDAAVITVPAAFDQPETEATRRAARLAGITSSPLLQEPIAASLAYGFQRTTDNVFWLVYDIGGGTFDAAVMHVQDGIIQVVNHGGDNDLGGKLIDWNLVEQVFVPALNRFDLPDFRRGNKRWTAAFAKLKLYAETAKIALSKDATYDISDEFICPDASGKPVQLDVSVTRGQLEQLAEPILIRTINICRNVLTEQRLRASDVSRIILVGGPTRMPLLRQMLPDPQHGLGIELDFSVDPLTVVAQGAAIFAATQKRLNVTAQAVKRDEFNLTLEYQPVGNTQDPLVAGKLEGASGHSMAEYSVHILNPQARPPWDSGRIPLQANGTFIANLHAERGEQNTFHIELFDQAGRKVPVTPSEFPYTVGMVIKDPPLPHDIGIAMSNDEVDVLFEKGIPLPNRHNCRHKTAFAIRKGDSAAVLRIPFVEGGNRTHASLNRKIGEVTIEPGKLRYDLPAGSDVEIRLQIDASRLITGTATVEAFDQEFPIHIEGLVKQGRPLGDLKEEFAEERKRLRLAIDSGNGASSTVGNELDRLKKENSVETVERLLDAGDETEAVQCEERLLTLKAAIQRIEDALAGPRLVAEAREEIKWTEEIVAGAPAEYQKAFNLLRPEVEAALEGDIDALRRKVQQLSSLRLRILEDRPEFWIAHRDYLVEHKAEMVDQQQASVWLSHANRAINQNDLVALRTACRQLWTLMPQKPQTIGYGGGTLRVREISA